jgi:hypothetical protein
MNKHIIPYCFIGLFLNVLVFSCSEDPHQLSLNIFNNELPGIVKDTVIYATRDTTYLIKSKVNTATSLRLALGSKNGFDARPIFRFTDFLSVPDSAIINGATIRIVPEGRTVEEGSTPFNVTIYPILNVWTSNIDSVWNDYLQNIDKTKPFGNSEISPDDTTDLVIPLNQSGVEMVNLWADTATAVDDNYGFILDYEEANFIQYYNSIASELDPELIINYTIPGDTTRFIDTLLANFDAYVYIAEIPVTENRNIVSTLQVFNTNLEFELRKFLESQPGEFSIISANLQMPIDLEESLLDANFNVESLVSLQLVSDFDSSMLEVDSTAGRWSRQRQWASDSSYLETLSGIHRQILATSIIRSIMSDPITPEVLTISFIDNLNTVIKISDEKDFYSYLHLYKATEQNPFLRPRLIIRYWVVPATRL